MAMTTRAPVGARREQIVEAAAELFSARGYNGTSMQEIAERVGLLKGSLYAHVSSKEELLLEIVSTAARLFKSALEPVMRRPLPAPERLRAALCAHLGVIARHRALAIVFLHESRHLEGQPARWVREEQDRYEALWQRLLRDGMAEGTFRRDLDPAAALAALGAANWACGRHEGEAELADLANRLCDLLLGGCLEAERIAARAAS